MLDSLMPEPTKRSAYSRQTLQIPTRWREPAELTIHGAVLRCSDRGDGDGFVAAHPITKEEEKTPLLYST